MALDIIEIALEKLTDNQAFEKLATDILYNEGYYSILPMPGGNDFGQDAIEDKFYETKGENRTVFQYSLQANSKGKIEKTIVRLNSAGIKFSELVYVTSRGITGENQEILKKTIRKNYGIPLTIFEKETIANRLADTKNGLFNRYFPDIESQIQSLKSNRPRISEEVGKSLEMSLLKVSITFAFNKNAIKARKDIFDNLLLSLIYDSKKAPLTIGDILELCKSSISEKSFNDEQIRAALHRLKSDKQLDQNLTSFSLSAKAVRKLEATNIAANQCTDELLDDIYDSVANNTTWAFSDQEKNRIRKNSLEVLLEIFKLYGIELTNQYLDQALQNSFDIGGLKEHFVSLAKNNLPPKIGELLIASIGQIIRTPTETQAKTIANWAKAFLAVKIMNFDPNLKELQHSQFSRKTFIIDTDFLLNCIVKERPNHVYFCSILKDLLKLGCKIIIPRNVFEECLNNASIAPRTFDYFGESLHSLTEEIAEYEVRNLFVQGYYHYYKKQKISFLRYLDNYFDDKDSVSYFEDVIYDVLPKEIEIVDLSTLKINIPQDKFDKFEAKLLEKLLQGPKAQYRTETQIKELAVNDTMLYLTCYYMNQNEANQGKILGGKAYLLTQSQKYARCAKSVGLTDIVTAKPQTLGILLDLVGRATIQPQEYIKLMDNPLLVYCVEQSWSDVLMLIKSGIDLEGKSLPRLRRDLQETLHDHIASYENMPADDFDEQPGINPRNGKLQKFIDLIKDAKRLGYKSLPTIDTFINEIETQEDKSENLAIKLITVSEQYETLKSEVENFGKRKQHYLSKINRRKK